MGIKTNWEPSYILGNNISRKSYLAFLLPVFKDCQEISHKYLTFFSLEKIMSVYSYKTTLVLIDIKFSKTLNFTPHYRVREALSKRFWVLK